MERYFLYEEDDLKIVILGQCYAHSYEEAQQHFDSKGCMSGNLISEADWCSELDLNAFENECC
jgi:hypothetical protein